MFTSWLLTFSENSSLLLLEPREWTTTVQPHVRKPQNNELKDAKTLQGMQIWTKVALTSSRKKKIMFSSVENPMPSWHNTWFRSRPLPVIWVSYHRLVRTGHLGWVYCGVTMMSSSVRSVALPAFSSSMLSHYTRWAKSHISYSGCAAGTVSWVNLSRFTIGNQSHGGDKEVSWGLKNW